MSDDVLKPVKITRNAVYIDGIELPGGIEDGGVIVKPGGRASINRLIVTFLVGAVDVEDPTDTAGAPA